MISVNLSNDFVWGIAAAGGVYAALQFMHLCSFPTAEELNRKAKKPVKIAAGQDDEVIVWGFNAHENAPGLKDGIPDASHFVTRVEVFCRLLGQPYTKKQTLDISENPRGKVPFASVFGVVLDDSTRIIKQLKGAVPEKAAALDAHLSEEQKTQGYLIQEMLFGTLYWVMVSQRMTQPLGREKMIKMLKRNGLPPGVRYLVGALIWRTATNALCKQGTGLLSRSEIIAKGQESVGHLALLVGKKDFLFGAKPSSFDAEVYSWLAILFFDESHAPYEWVKELRERHPNLVAYVKRMRERVFPELEG